MTIRFSIQPERTRAKLLLIRLVRLSTFSIILGLFAMPAWVSAKCLTQPGDVSGDGKTNIIDVQCVILSALWELTGGNVDVPSCVAGKPYAADLTCEGAITVADVVLVTYLVLGQDLNPDIDANGNGCADACETEVVGVAPQLTTMFFSGISSNFQVGIVVRADASVFGGISSGTDSTIQPKSTP